MAVAARFQRVIRPVASATITASRTFSKSRANPNSPGSATMPPSAWAARVACVASVV
jgi:hypothetical protein